MNPLQIHCGRIVELRRHTNTHLLRNHGSGPTDRYELWLKVLQGRERMFTIHTMTMPARSGYEVSLIEAPPQSARRATQVLGLVNWTAQDAVNYLRSDPPGLLRGRDFVAALAAAILAAVASGEAGAVLATPVVWLLAAVVVRAGVRGSRAREIDELIAAMVDDHEATTTTTAAAR
jgi:hypothetical protein